MRTHFPNAKIPVISPLIKYEHAATPRVNTEYVFVTKEAKFVNATVLSAVWEGPEGDEQKHTYTGISETLMIADKDAGYASIFEYGCEEVSEVSE